MNQDNLLCVLIYNGFKVKINQLLKRITTICETDEKFLLGQIRKLNKKG